MSDEPRRDELPIPDYDHLPVGSLGHRIRSLPEADLRTLLAYEQAHAGRVAVTQLTETRIGEVQGGAELSGGDAAAPAAEAAGAPAGQGAVGPETQGPHLNPPSHGDPTNPAQPR
ncbi:hypothetical protein ICW40_03560 [Actinotalea ferrariae]|uniref:hypothetical protein n=1 Tax=Actinotalea ferrariae TaxID=1386098 RepID=UPI001C8B5777|nr:hypothetical protein [Actinotalea ferrariae]MBX9243882.1 hypothetical protein [Actinotalea ferrariae]